VTAIDDEGLAGLPRFLSGAGSRRILILTGDSRRHLDRVRARLDGMEVPVAVDVFAGARRHVPEAVLRAAREQLDSFAADTIVALGGGSAIGLGKALRRERQVRFVAIPTTYAGSELTNIYGVTTDGAKTTGRDPRVRPDAVIHDVELTLDMPRTLTVTSLMNALGHPIGALSTGSLQGEARARAFDAIEILYAAIEALVRAPEDRRARANALRGAGLAAQALETGTTGLHHQLAHRLGGRFDLDHSGLHSVLLPHSIHRLRADAPEIVDEISRRLAVPDLESGLFDFLLRAGAGVSLRALGVTFDGLRGLLAEAPELPGELLRAAFHGRRPSADTRFEDWGLPELVSVRGPRPEDARRVVGVGWWSACMGGAPPPTASSGARSRSPATIRRSAWWRRRPRTTSGTARSTPPRAPRSVRRWRRRWSRRRRWCGSPAPAARPIGWCSSGSRKGRAWR
jgi:maleylacetate reductase